MRSLCRSCPVMISITVSLWGCGEKSPSGTVPPPPPPPGGESYSVAYATYIGGNDLDELREPVVLPGGRLLFGARTKSGNMPTTPGAYDRSGGGADGDAWLGILSDDGSALEAATYFGGSGMERATYGIAVASDGDVVFTTGTTSPDIPTAAGSYRRDLHAPVPQPGGGFVCRISSNLTSLRWCTYTGGGWPRGGLTLDAQDNVLVTGRVTGGGFATTAGAFMRDPEAGAFVLKLAADGGSAIWSTRIGGPNGLDASVSIGLYQGDILLNGHTSATSFPVTSGAAQVTRPGSSDAWIARLSGDGSQLIYATYFGGSGNEFGEHRQSILADGSAVSVGVTRSPNLPTTAGSYGGNGDGYLTVVSPDGARFTMAQYIGTSSQDAVLGPTILPDGKIVVFGYTESRNFPVTSDGIQKTYAGGLHDGIVMLLSPSGTTLYSTYLGGNGDDIIRGVAASSDGSLFVIGRTTSTDLPTTPGAFQSNSQGQEDGFVIKLSPGTG